jgi:hypothetical protein
MDRKASHITRGRVLTCIALLGLFCELAALEFHLDSLKVPIVLYGYVALGASSYLIGYSVRVFLGRYGANVPRAYGVLSGMLAILLLMLVSELQFLDIGFLAAITAILTFLALGLLHKPPVQTPKASITTLSRT